MNFEWCGGAGMSDSFDDEEEDEYGGFMDDKEDSFDDIDTSNLLGSNDEVTIDDLQEQVNKSLDMFRRFKNL